LEQAAVGPSTAAGVFADGAAAARGEGVAALLHAAAALEWKRGEDGAARALFDRAVGVDPGAGWIWLWYGRFEAAAGGAAAAAAAVDGAAAAAAAAADGPAGGSDAADGGGEGGARDEDAGGGDPRARGGWLARAAHYYARAVNADPADPSPWRAWAELERAAGNEERARFRHRRAAALTADAAFGGAAPPADAYPLARPWTRRTLGEWP